MNYTQSIYRYARRKTIEVGFGIIKLGGLQPIRVESMVNTDTRDIQATVKQCIELYEAGCEIIRITAPSIKDAECLEFIRNELRAKRIQTPLVADIHFTPNAAMKAAEFVENVRINPGNYADKKKFATIEYTDSEYNEELERIHKEFKPLVLKCKEYGRSMRIGTNHGSLSDRIMSRYGDSPLGMVESALEFARICALYDYHEIIFSMKSSIPQVMVQAYRLLVRKLQEEKMKPYPLHLGVTEAGNGDVARIKSSIGIGSLLEDGLGDTIRVSLTENPINEIPIGKEIVRTYNKKMNVYGENDFEVINNYIRPNIYTHEILPFTPYEYNRRKSSPVTIGQYTIGNLEIPRVESTIQSPLISSDVQKEFLTSTFPEEIKTEICNFRIASLQEFHQFQNLHFVGTISITTEEPLVVLEACHQGIAKIRFLIKENEPFPTSLLKHIKAHNTTIEFCFVKKNSTDGGIAELLTNIAKQCQAENLRNVLFSIQSSSMVFSYRKLWSKFHEENIFYPIALCYWNSSDSKEIICTDMSIQVGTLLLDGIGDILFIETKLDRETELNFVYDILQATRQRLIKTEFISCPSCGRTQFDLEIVTAEIQSQTKHLKGIKIAIMGCIVNGPGEMADADFGYIGTGANQISLYVGKECVQKNINQSEAVEKLITLIKEHGKWREPAVV